MAELFEMPVRGEQLTFGLSFGEERPEDRETEGAPPDWKERERALDVTASWIVEAPAGSGKTGLLIQRYLKLLAEGEVDRPEQVLAITFTNAATEEIRERVMSQIEGAAAATEVKGAFEQKTRALAGAVLRRDREMGWGLLDAPRRLNVRTIDSVCAEIARALPVTSGGTAGVPPVEEAEPMYREAGRRTLLQLGGGDTVLDEALQTMLLHRDGSLAECERLIAEMLTARDQWGELVPLGRDELTEERLEGEVRPRLNRALELAVCQGLGDLVRVMPEGFLARLTELATEMAERPGYKGNLSPLAICSELRSEPEEAAEHLSYWRALIHLLVTPSTSTWRKGFNVNQVGFATSKGDQERLKALLGMVEDNAEVLQALRDVSSLPPGRYPEEQWEVAKAFFRVLSRALVELQLVFAERGECDFAEPALLARAALRQERGVEGWESALGMELRHLLVDEMQDTSTSQYELIELLTEGWQSEGKTAFLVGDPKQSIYLFRQARVERFVATMKSERIGEMHVGRLRLTANFRSQAGLVRAFNQEFALIFTASGDQDLGNQASGKREVNVPFVPAAAVRGAADEVEGEGGLAWHTAIVSGTAAEISETAGRVAKRNAIAIRELAARWRARPLPPGRTDPWRIAVLVGTRRELREIVAAMKVDYGRGTVPFRAVEVEPLKERREVLDLLALTRALKHPADRVAWWAVLRAPWCGLGLADLHMLAGEDDRQFAEATVMHLVATRGELLPPESIGRLERVWPVLQAAMEKRSRLRVPELVERTWRSLGGDAALSATEMANAMRYLELLDEVDRETGGVELAHLNRRMERLYALSDNARGAVDLMTIHGAKGLEWDVVMVPELERKAPPIRSRLLDWEEIPGGDQRAAGVVLAPITGKGKDSEALNGWLRGIRSAREAAQRRRLFYVACTRAREELHLFGTANVPKDGTVKAGSGSLLEAAWPAAKVRFTLDAGVMEVPERAEEREGLSLAAAADEVAVEAKEKPAMLERFPSDFDSLARFRGRALWQQAEVEQTRPRFERPEGSFAARSFGNAVHTFLELAARRMEAGVGAKELLAEVVGWKDRIAAVLRGDGLLPAVVERLAGRVVAALTNTLREPVGQWLLGARVDARSEYALTLWNERWSRVRIDRVFRAGVMPAAEGAECLWVVDYKTGSHGAERVEVFLESERAKYAGQMETYARALGPEEVRVGLWYPMVGRLVWWIV